MKITAEALTRYAKACIWLEIAVAVTLALAFSPRIVRWAKAEIHEVDVLRGETRELVKDVKDSWDDSYWDIKATIETFTMLAKDSEEFVADLHASIVGGKDSHGVLHAGILPEVHDLVGDMRGTVQELTSSLKHITADVDNVTGAAVKTLEPLKAALEHVSSLTDRLDQEVAKGSPKMLQTIDELNKALADVDKLLANPDIAKTIANVQETTKSVDMALRPWRERVAFLKTLLGKLVSIVKVTVPLPW